MNADTFCSCRKGRRRPDGFECACADVGPLPTVWLKGEQDVYEDQGKHCGLDWRIVVERVSDTEADCTIMCSDLPNAGLMRPVVRWITVHESDPRQVSNVAQEVCSALLWSRLRMGWLDNEQ